MQLVCLDLEGVLVPEIWIEFAERTGIPELRRTTRDEPNYDTLMKYRLDILAQKKLGLPDIQEVIAGMGPLPGAGEFLDRIRQRAQVVLGPHEVDDLDAAVGDHHPHALAQLARQLARLQRDARQHLRDRHHAQIADDAVELALEVPRQRGLRVREGLQAGRELRVEVVPVGEQVARANAIADLIARQAPMAVQATLNARMRRLIARGCRRRPALPSHECASASAIRRSGSWRKRPGS